MRAIVVLLAVAMLAPTAVAFHRSVGGDVSANFPPADEASGPDITGDAPAQVEPNGGLTPAGVIEYTNSVDFPTFDRTSPPDQYYNGGGIGFFDVIDIQYYGAYQLSDSDAVDAVIADEGGSHDATYSPNLYFGAPEATDVNALVPGALGDGHSGVLYPGQVMYYAYLFGDGNAEDANGAPYLAGDGVFADLVPADVCDLRATQRCQLFAPRDLDALGTTICGWNPTGHTHPGADVLSCRDFDFGFVSDNTADLQGQNQPESPAWIWSGTPGWYGNVVPIGGTYQTAYEVFHFTVGADFDPAVLANGGINADGDGLLDCLEPGFDVDNVLAHDLDIYDPYNMDARPIVQNADAIVDEALGPAGPIVDEVLGTAIGLVNQATQPVGLVITDRQARPYYAEDTHGAIENVLSTKLECVDEDGDHAATAGLIEQVDGTTWQNWMEGWIWQTVTPLLGLGPFTDHFETLSGSDHENAGGGVSFYFGNKGGLSPSGMLGQVSTAGDVTPMYDGLYDVGENCETAGSFGNKCIGTFMLEVGYRDPTSLVFVLNVDGPVAFQDRRTVTHEPFEVYADTGRHCVIGASKNVFDAATGQTLREHAVLEAVYKRATGDTDATLPAGGAALEQAILDEICGGADTLDLFPGQGFTDHPNGDSVNANIGWTLPATGMGRPDIGEFDAYYVLSVDASEGFTGQQADNLDLHTLQLGEPTVVAEDYVEPDSVTMVWQNHADIGSQ